MSRGTNCTPMAASVMIQRSRPAGLRTCKTMTTRIHSTLAAACTLLAAASAGAQPASTNSLEEIIVTATRMEKELDRVPAAVSVVTQEDIQLARQKLALAEAFRSGPRRF